MQNLQKVDQNVQKIENLGVNTANLYTGSLSYNTRRAYERHVREFFGVKSLSEVTIEQIKGVSVATAKQYRDKLFFEDGKSISTVNQVITALAKFYSILCRKEVGIMDYNPFSSDEGTARIKNVNKNFSDTRCLTREEVQKLVKITMQGQDALALRNRIIILMLATTGIRRQEIVNIKVSQIKNTQGVNVVDLKITKGNKPRLVKLSNTLFTFITKYIETMGLTPDSYLIQNHSSNKHTFSNDKRVTEETIYNVVKRIADKAGIGVDDVSPHCLRHTFITEALTLGYPLEEVQDLAGHSDISTTRRYDHTLKVLKHNPADELEQIFLGKED